LGPWPALASIGMRSWMHAFAQRRAAEPRCGRRMADNALAELTASDIREAYDAAAWKSPRRATCAMQVLRAVLRWHGVAVADNALGRGTAGRDRITIAAPKGDPSPIPPELPGAW
jgi:hypothetical protein